MATKREGGFRGPSRVVHKTEQSKAVEDSNKRLYFKKPAKGVSHGWTVFTPDGEALCYVGDAAIADNLLNHLNRDET